MKRCIDCKFFKIGFYCLLCEGNMTFQDIIEQGGFCKLGHNSEPHQLACKSFDWRKNTNAN
jgi:hypothetical protein